MIVYDNVHYSRYLTLYWASMKSLNEADTKWTADGNFSFSLTGRPYSSIPPDQTIEMCMNKDSKIKGGWIGITKNLFMVNTNSQTVNKIATIKDTLMEFSKRKKSEVGHRENVSSRKLIDEKAVQDMDSCITEWECDPWDLSKCTVRSLESGLKASKELIDGFTSAHNDGEVKLQEIIEARIRTTKTTLLEPIKRNKRISFTKEPEKNTKSSNMKFQTMEIENRAMINLVQLAEQSKLDLNRVMQFRLTDIPLSIFNVNECMRKVVKSKLMAKFTLVRMDDYLVNCDRVIIDMGLLWRKGMPSKEDWGKPDGSDYTWNDYATKLFKMISQSHPKGNGFHLINDRYDTEWSVKDSEHKRRAGETFSRNVYPKPNSIIPSAVDFAKFFVNNGNKIRLQSFLKTQFSMLAKEHNKSFNLVVSVLIFLHYLTTNVTSTKQTQKCFIM